MSDRQLYLDLEITGFEPKHGDRIAEIAIVEARHGRLTGRCFHTWLNPEQPIEKAVLGIIGIGDEWLREQPCFDQIAGNLLSFLWNAELFVYRADASLPFLDAELARADCPEALERIVHVTDLQRMARGVAPQAQRTFQEMAAHFGIAAPPSGDAMNCAALMYQLHQRLVRLGAGNP